MRGRELPLEEYFYDFTTPIIKMNPGSKGLILQVGEEDTKLKGDHVVAP